MILIKLTLYVQQEGRDGGAGNVVFDVGINSIVDGAVNVFVNAGNVEGGDAGASNAETEKTTKVSGT